MIAPMKRMIIDPFSFYDYKPSFSGNAAGIAPVTVVTWVPEEDRRRLRAYMLLEAYCRNSSREWMSTQDDKSKTNRREYGDPGTIIHTVLSSLLGDDQSITIDEAEGDDYESAADEQLQVLLRWAEKESFIKKVVETERNAAKLGDGVFALSWDAKKKRPRLRCYDPGFYFPIWEDDRAEDEGYPFKVHMAWEYERPRPSDPTKKDSFVRRLTWELVELAGPVQYKWNDDPSELTCLFSDGYWKVNDFKDASDLTPKNATWNVQDLDLQIDFIPVVHIPNDVSEQEHWGTSCLANIMQIFDDSQSTDTDLQASSATTGSPPIALSGASAPKNEDGTITSYGPGTVLETGDGNATVIDTSRSLDALIKYQESLLSRMSVNGRIPESLMGRIKPSEVPSGIALTLSFSPHTSMIREMRLVRKEKYRLLFRFVCRMLLSDGQLKGKLYEADLHFGSFLPADRQETATIVQTLLQSKAISTETGIRMLVEAGFPIEDALEELDNIHAENFAAANELLDATGNADAVGKYLGVKVDPLLEPQPEPEPEPDDEEPVVPPA